MSECPSGICATASSCGLGAKTRVFPSAGQVHLPDREALIETTDLCNFRCPACRESQDPRERTRGFMPVPLFESLLDELVRMGVRKVTIAARGEPFLDPFLEDKIRMAADRGLETWVATNASQLHLSSRSSLAIEFETETGLRLTKGEAAVLAGLTGVRFNLFGSSPESYHEATGCGSFEKVRRNILEVLAFRPGAPARNIRIGAGASRLKIACCRFDTAKAPSPALQAILDAAKRACSDVEVRGPYRLGAGRTCANPHAGDGLQNPQLPVLGPFRVDWGRASV